MGPRIYPLPDCPPWFRVALGRYHVLVRPMTAGERAAHACDAPVAFAVARIVSEQELHHAITGLSFSANP